MINKMLIACPFGNWLQWNGYTSTVGSYTREYRGGKWKQVWRMLRTLRPCFGCGGWRNRLGLPNPGIQAIPNNIMGPSRIISLAANKVEDWKALIERVCDFGYNGIELNISCPNWEKPNWGDLETVFRYAMVCGVKIIVKLPPVGYEPIVEVARNSCVIGYHCCNTLGLPDNGGGLSGKPLMPLSLACVRYVKKLEPMAMIIGGGGITSLDDVKRYRDAGATNYSVGSAILNPFRWRTLKKLPSQL